MPDPMTAEAISAIMPPLREAMREAAGLALPYFRLGTNTSARTWSKAGGSPVTEADVEVDTFLKIRLSQIVPEAAWLSEETADDPARLDSGLVWIVDPIDGTRAFLSGHPDWSIAVALLAAGEPVIGFVHAPAGGKDYEARKGLGATCNGTPIAVSRQAGLPGARVTGPKPMFDRLGRGVSAEGREADFIRIDRVPSLALRVARVAEGSIDVGLISSNARDWDLAAADLVLREAGGSVSDMAGRPTRYNRADPVHGELIAVPHGLRDPVIAGWNRGA
ncbi:3'(2'),5'-bisphosphate nucleotidase CysQ [Methylobacterium trifolii]|uniref:Fructose-1, 6-bisphosphatase/inositol-1-monophosphatase n=1 Tax=Methylobacterium trifolii TaxID=1003092 RepID=A0ABQ4TU41_9HYPH|nr:3'(2'),5'-bisphosphate nucleotidase CysQ [Methylobacterium trifolii]GJE58829.1 Fructose-1,6-bisphosphatase/inositol-1-monophosphatase [Methylobacterium trifolii]